MGANSERVLVTALLRLLFYDDAVLPFCAFSPLNIS